MTSPRFLVGAVAIAMLLTGCASSVSADPTPTATQSSTPTPTPTPVPAAIIVSGDALTVLDSAGGVVEAAKFGEGDSLVALMTKINGADPVIDDTYLAPKGFRIYTWTDARCSTSHQFATCHWSAPAFGGLAVSTSQGIHIGSSRADVLALDHFDRSYDGDGDGLPDSVGLEPLPAPDQQSLEHPGEAGTTFINVTFTGDTVTDISAPASDFYDL